MICTDYDLCERCFADSSTHTQHPFIGREGFDSQWIPADRRGIADAESENARPTSSTASAAGESSAPRLAVELLTKLPVRSAGPVEECGQCELCSSNYRQMQVRIANRFKT